MSTSLSLPIEQAAIRAAKAAGGASALAKSLGVTASAVSNWRKTGIPSDRMPAVSRITGIPMQELRPDLFEVEVA